MRRQCEVGLPACKVQPGTEGGTGLENVQARQDSARLTELLAGPHGLAT